MIFGKFMVSDTSLRYNLGLDNFVLMETGPVCISSREKGGQLHVCTYYVLVDKSSSVVRACGDTVSHRTALKNHMQVWQERTNMMMQT